MASTSANEFRLRPAERAIVRQKIEALLAAAEHVAQLEAARLTVEILRADLRGFCSAIALQRKADGRWEPSADGKRLVLAQRHPASGD